MKELIGKWDEFTKYVYDYNQDLKKWWDNMEKNGISGGVIYKEESMAEFMEWLKEQSK